MIPKKSSHEVCDFTRKMSDEERIPKKKTFLGQPPAITLYPDSLYKEASEPEGTDMRHSTVSYLLRVDPEQADGDKYKKYISRFENGSPEELLNTLEDVREVWSQNSIDQAGSKWGIVKTVFKGQSWLTLSASMGGQNPTENCINVAIKALKDEVFPFRSLETQILWMRREMRKPFKMSVRKYYTRVDQLNGYLKHFPKGTNDLAFSNQEIREIIEYSLPYHWREEFDRLGFKPTNAGVTKGQFLEKAEAVERYDPQKKEKKNKKGTKTSKSQEKTPKKKGHSDPKSPRKDKWCDYCEKPTHNTTDCYTLKRLKEEKASKNTTANTKKHRNEINAIFEGMSEADLKRSTEVLKKLAQKKKKADGHVIDLSKTAFGEGSTVKKTKVAFKEKLKNLGNSESENDSDEEMSDADSVSHSEESETPEVSAD